MKFFLILIENQPCHLNTIHFVFACRHFNFLEYFWGNLLATWVASKIY